MDRTPDLDTALSFVIRRIEEQAKQSGEALSNEQRSLLNNLPSSTPVAWVPGPYPGPLVPRNIDYERLCALGKTARLSDRQLSPASLDWDFAFAVLQLNNHPMWGLVRQAGVKYRRPLWDQLLLIIAALLFTAAMMALMFFAGEQPWTLFQWAEIGSGSVAVLLLAYLASRRAEKWQLEKHIEKCRRASRFANTSASYSS
jgi:hypothetical protein